MGTGLRGTVALATGASSGIGAVEEAARALGRLDILAVSELLVRPTEQER
jgi:hypothetical protein